MVTLVHWGIQVPTVPLDDWEHQDQMDPQDPEVLLERRGHLVKIAYRELPDLLDHQGVQEER